MAKKPANTTPATKEKTEAKPKGKPATAKKASPTTVAKADKKVTYEPGGETKKLTLKVPTQAEVLPERRGVKKVLVAYSGGLDTSVMIPWLIENYGCEVVAFAADLGQGGDVKQLKQKAINTGAKKCIVEDLRKEFVEDFILPAIMANALYEGKYPMHTSLGRPLIAKRQVEIALAEGCDAVTHGCTGKGNDQARFEFTFMALAPQLRIIAPLREWEMKTRDDEFEYAEQRGIYLPISRQKPYSIDKNLYGLATECGVLEDPWHVAPEEAYQDVANPVDAPNTPEEIVIGFEQGIPVSLNGKKKSALALIEELQTIGNKHGIGRIDMVENRLVGIKSREVYEGPAATMLIMAHKEIESLVLDRETISFKQIVDQKFTDVIYNGTWFSPFRESLFAFIKDTQQFVTGEVKLLLYKGLARPIARRSPYSLYDTSLATYDAGDRFDRTKAEGFLRIFGMPLEIHYGRKQRIAKMKK
ncbi:MAG: argininosuccinate synthase [Candidatus Sumerlaeia bacterium]|nr:argininosuccinate synthase [Candidatus Sumerlaeia bacterium]